VPRGLRKAASRQSEGRKNNQQDEGGRKWSGGGQRKCHPKERIGIDGLGTTTSARAERSDRAGKEAFVENPKVGRLFPLIQKEGGKKTSGSGARGKNEEIRDTTRH